MLAHDFGQSSLVRVGLLLCPLEHDGIKIHGQRSTHAGLLHHAGARTRPDYFAVSIAVVWYALARKKQPYTSGLTFYLLAAAFPQRRKEIRSEAVRCLLNESALDRFHDAVGIDPHRFLFTKMHNQPVVSWRPDIFRILEVILRTVGEPCRKSRNVRSTPGIFLFPLSLNLSPPNHRPLTKEKAKEARERG
ncbi:MAG: hypothetical protein EXS38_00165 [Opitutus sp.]|nr:hypothetical protein [Opitutus sp.]